MINTEKIYEEVIKLKKLFDEDEQKYIDLAVQRNERTQTPLFPWVQVANLIMDLRDEMAEQSTKATGKNALFKYCTAILKYNMRDGGRVSLTFSKVLSDGYQYACDGYRAIKIKEYLPLPECPPEIGYPALDKIVPNSLTGFEELTVLPSVAGLKTYYKICKAEKKNIMSGKQVLYRFGEHLINAQWLYETMEALPNAKVYVDNYCRFLFVDEERDIKALILGVREAALANYEYMEVV